MWKPIKASVDELALQQQSLAEDQLPIACSIDRQPESNENSGLPQTLHQHSFSMNKKHLTQLWIWLSVACVLYLTTTVISLQGGTEFLGRLFGDKGSSAVDNRPAVGYFGAIIGGGLLFLGSCILALHARRHGSHWHSRLPVAWLEGLDTHAWEAKLYQMIILVIFMVLPLIGVVRCMEEAESGDICEENTSRVHVGRETTLLWPPSPQNDKNQIRLRKADSGPTPCEGGVEVFSKSLTPLLFYGLPVGAAAASVAALVSIFRLKARNRRATG